MEGYTPSFLLKMDRGASKNAWGHKYRELESVFEHLGYFAVKAEFSIVVHIPWIYYAFYNSHMKNRIAYRAGTRISDSYMVRLSKCFLISKMMYLK